MPFIDFVEELTQEIYMQETPEERGPRESVSQKLHEMKYRSKGEGFRDAMNRVASTLSDNDEHFKEFRDILLDMRFLPAGRIQSAIGSSRRVTAYNCFVSGVLNDNLVSGLGNGAFFKDGGIMSRATEAAQTMRLGGGIGYDFSTLRPRGDRIKSMDTSASGPVSFMDIYDAVCRTIASAGHRRGAQMAVLRVDHPDIEEFIFAKQNNNRLNGFNISIGVTDEFMEAVAAGKPFDLQWNGEVYKTVDASALWEQVMRSTWDYAEPGVLFLDTINRLNNLYYCETINATNPCAEQPLPPYGACLLGSLNLTAYITSEESYEDDEGFMVGYGFDWEQFIKDIPPIVRAMDNVIDSTIYPLKEQEIEAKNKRRMGIGITGLANAGEALGYPYGSKSFIEFEGKILKALLETAYSTSALIAKDKGAFPWYDERYLNGEFVKRLEPETLDLIKRYGIRNSHLTSIAPTGTISFCADNISSGLEPVFAYKAERTVLEFEGTSHYEVVDYGYKNFGIEGKRTSECSIDDHLGVLIEAYKYVDSAVSKTCNVDPNMSWKDFKSVYTRAWESDCKGCTTFNIGGKRMGILKEKDEIDPERPGSVTKSEACFVDPETGSKSCE
jgi:ribonucleoside-diphosphate reductase alpha chain